MIRLYGEFDVVIVGGGTTGAVAGITAARQGLKTLIVESMGFLGGSQTGALVTPMMKLLIKNDPEISSINKEIQTKLEDVSDGRGLWFNPEGLKTILEEMFVEAGGQLLYFTSVIDAKRDQDQIKEIIIHNKSGIQRIESKIFIDCSGDADLATLVDVNFESGKKATGINQPMSVRFEVENVDMKRFGFFMKSLGQGENIEPHDIYGAHTFDRIWPLTPIFKKALEDNVILEKDAEYFQLFAIPGKERAISFNCPEIFENIDGTNVDHLTSAMIEGRQMIKRLMKFMKINFKGFENAYISTVAPMVGVRESRRIIGDYQLKAEDVAQSKKFNDGIVKCNYYMDVHGLSEEEQKALDKWKEDKVPEEEQYFEIPYRCCITKDIQNLLVAGRCISADFEAQSAMRIQLVCRALGEACGYASYIAINNKIAPNKVNGEEVRAMMIKYGADL